MESTFLYALCEPDTGAIRYVGKTTKPEQRFRQHLTSKAKTYLGYWIRSRKKSGRTPRLLILKETVGDGSEVERRFIRLARGLGMDLVNSTDGGEGLLNPSQETRRKMRERQLGAIHSEEHRFKCGSSNRGKHLTPEHRAAIGAANKGKTYIRGPMSEEHKLKLSISHKGKSFSEAHCSALSKAHIGLPWSAKRRAAHEAKKIRLE